jgi:septal ring factor EnvC (AmiA/AmiB activator)
LPRELKDSVLFTRAQLLQLIDRKRELDEEIATLRKQQAEARTLEAAKRKEINEHKKMRNEKEREYNERQMLRFGNLIDLDSLEVSGPSQAVLDK